jgi:hemolysin activation/secretion protein
LIEGFYSRGGLSDNNKDAIFDASRLYAKARYSYGRFTVERQFNLPFGFTYVGKGTLQVTGENLLSGEQLGAGGWNSVRGYDEREVNGDTGYIINHELRTPWIPINIFDRENLRVNNKIQFLAFYDTAHLENQQLVAGEIRAHGLNSAGGGLRYEIDRFFDLRFDYGFQLTDTGLNSAGRNSYGHLGLNLAY